MNMNSKNSSIRPLGQRSITSTFLFRASNRSSDCKKDVEIKAPSQKGSHPSLSDFLHRKLHRSTVLPSALQGKEVPFSPPISGEESNRRGVGESGDANGREAESSFSLDGISQLFKNVEKDKNDHTDSQSSNETGSLTEDALLRTRKRKNLLNDEEKPSAPKMLAVLGDDSKPLQRANRRNFVRKDEHKPLFNHYENGGGWWDDNMEGVDNEEVGCNDAWEGVGCTTLGGIEWH